MLESLREYNGFDFEYVKAKEFEDMICSKLAPFGVVERQVHVDNRGDGRSGRVDLVLHSEEGSIGIEIDRKRVRQKSIFKLRRLGADKMYSILRSPFSVNQIT